MFFPQLSILNASKDGRMIRNGLIIIKRIILGNPTLISQEKFLDKSFKRDLKLHVSPENYCYIFNRF